MQYLLPDQHPPAQRPTWTMAHDDLCLRVWVGRFPPNPSAGQWTAEDLFTARTIVFEITDDGRCKIAAGALEMWRANWPPYDEDVDLYPSIDEFRIEAEGYSSEAAEMSEAVFRMWGDAAENIFDFGSLLMFDRLRIETASKAQSLAVWSLITHLLDRLGRWRDRPALMALKAFPLEFMGQMPDEPMARCDYSRRLRVRRSALQRLYRNRLSMEPLPGRYSEWMWRTFNRYVEPPRLTRRKDPAA
jgi:hypothetical protein